MSNTIPEAAAVDGYKDAPPPELKPNIHVPEKGMSKNMTGYGPSVRTSLITKEIGHFKGNDDEIDDDKLRLFIRNVIKEKRRAEDTRKWLYVALIALVLLCAANIGTAYLAVSLAKDTEVSGVDAQFVSTKTGEMVGTMGYRQMLTARMMPSSREVQRLRSLVEEEFHGRVAQDIDEEGEEDVIDGINQGQDAPGQYWRYFCVETVRWGDMLGKASKGANIGLIARYESRNWWNSLNREVDSRKWEYPEEWILPDEETETGIQLRWGGAELTESRVCIPVEENDGIEVEKMCMTFEDEDSANTSCNDPRQNVDIDNDIDSEVRSWDWENRVLNANVDEVSASSSSSRTKKIFMSTYRGSGSSNNVHEVKDSLNFRSRMLRPTQSRNARHFSAIKLVPPSSTSAL